MTTKTNHPNRRRRRAKKAPVCCLCNGPLDEWGGSLYGHNPYPLVDDDDVESRCCGLCNETKVLPERLRRMQAAWAKELS
jgi:hypothetical protein